MWFLSSILWCSSFFVFRVCLCYQEYWVPLSHCIGGVSSRTTMIRIYLCPVQLLFVSSRNALHSFLICCHQQLMNSTRSLANRKGSIHPEKGEKRKQYQWAQVPATSHLATRKRSSDKIILPSSVNDEIIHTVVIRPSIFASTLFPRLQLTIN